MQYTPDCFITAMNSNYTVGHLKKSNTKATKEPFSLDGVWAQAVANQ